MVQNIASESNFTTVLASIIHALPGRAHIKRADDFTYMMTNTATLKLLGMQQAQQLIGLDDYQVSKHMEKRWPAQLAQQLQEMDYSILSTNTPLIGKEEMPYLDADGNLVIHALTKIPLCDLNNQPFGILTLAIDTTHLKDIMFLKNAYLNLYDKPRDAHLSFIKHLGLDRIHADLADLITIRELECLILFARGFTAKEIGRQLSISNRTVERHFETVKAKFNCNTRSDAISLFLSNFNFYTPGIAGYK
jgi:DNA-binding CsgD family transcriptional regulator